MAETKEQQIIEDVKEVKRSKNKSKELNNLFPLTTQALGALSSIYSMTEEEYQDASGRDKEIANRPMLFLAQKLCAEFGYSLTNDLIKYIAVLNGLNLRVDNDNWVIKIEREDI